MVLLKLLNTDELQFVLEHFFEMHEFHTAGQFSYSILAFRLIFRTLIVLYVLVLKIIICI